MWQVFIILFHSTLVKCLIPDLSVQMLDRRIIERKRQDTLDMCRLFTAENEKLTSHHVNTLKNKTRSKRDIEKPVNEKENVKRVESIVDKLYEDLEENGVRVTYRQRNLDTSSLPDKAKNLTMSMRRFNFAPAELLGPAPTTENIMKQNVTTADSSGNIDIGIDWPKRWKHGIIPYFIDSKTYDTQLSDSIMKAFEYFEKSTCIRLQRLKDRPTDTDSLLKVEWLFISNPNGIRQCVHSNEKKTNKGVQTIVFGYDCMSLGEIVHEVMHILGFSHEHTRPDRDQYVTIMWNNIKSGYKKFFEIRSSDALMNIPYDHASVLHYPARAFSKNGQITILTPPGTRLGQRDGLSESDVDKVGIIYGNECVERNRQYLLMTCPSVVKADAKKQTVTSADIVEYFKDRLWPYGVVNYKLKDRSEFSAEERENIKAVIRHIEKETCIKFRDITVNDEIEVDANEDTNDASENKSKGVSEQIGFREGQKESSGSNENVLIPQDSQEVSNDTAVHSQDQVDNSDNDSSVLSQDPQDASENVATLDSQQNGSSGNDILSDPQLIGSSDNSIIAQEISSIDNAILSDAQNDMSSNDNTISQGLEQSSSSENGIVSQEPQNSDISEGSIISQNTEEGTDFSDDAIHSQVPQELDSKNSNDNVFLPQEDNENPNSEQEASENDDVSLIQAKETSSENEELLNQQQELDYSEKGKLLREGKNCKLQKASDKPKKIVKRSASITQAKPQRRHAEDFLVFARSEEPGCSCPTPGKPGGVKELYINADCFNSVNDLLHLFVHLLGLEHQHNMYDRDSYLHILWEKLTPDVREEMKETYPPAASLGFDYDYQSVMHYPWLQIKNGVTNIMYPIWNDGWAMGHWQGLSSTDVKKLNLLYSDQCLKRKNKLHK